MSRTAATERARKTMESPNPLRAVATDLDRNANVTDVSAIVSAGSLRSVPVTWRQ